MVRHGHSGVWHSVNLILTVAGACVLSVDQAPRWQEGASSPKLPSAPAVHTDADWTAALAGPALAAVLLYSVNTVLPVAHSAPLLYRNLVGIVCFHKGANSLSLASLTPAQVALLLCRAILQGVSLQAV